MNDFAAALRTHRERLGLTQEQIGALLPDMDGQPVPRRTWQDWERGVAEPPGYAQPLILRVLKAASPRRT